MVRERTYLLLLLLFLAVSLALAVALLLLSCCEGHGWCADDGLPISAHNNLNFP